ncbi:MAG TPA: hypothetical protein VNT75_04375, partial [Symbiobacteriaceae bacterium]|nr:hypothetical protein [Symbiobacteriaceae bacterium]
MRLATRLSLSYIGFLTLLAVLVMILAGIQLTRLFKYQSSIPVPASAVDASNIAKHLAQAGLGAPIPQQLLKTTLDAGGWAQILDADGREVQSVAAPEDRKRVFTAAEMAAWAQWVNPTGRWYTQLKPVVEADT